MCNKKMMRLFRNRHKIKIIEILGKKAYILHLENGYVGNKDVGYKNVKAGDFDITSIRNCNRIKEEGND